MLKAVGVGQGSSAIATLNYQCEQLRTVNIHQWWNSPTCGRTVTDSIRPAVEARMGLLAATLEGTGLRKTSWTGEDSWMVCSKIEQLAGFKVIEYP